MIRLPPTLALAAPTDKERHVAECKRRKAVAWLGTMWLLHPKNAPQKRIKP